MSWEVELGCESDFPHSWYSCAWVVGMLITGHALVMLMLVLCVRGQQPRTAECLPALHLAAHAPAISHLICLICEKPARKRQIFKLTNFQRQSTGRPE